jgi:rhodanese-related sulfurtransferase
MKSLLNGVFALALVWLAGFSAIAAEQRVVTARDAMAMAQRGELVLVDIRAPEEWRETGIGAGAHAISMHEPDFLERLEALIGGDKVTAIALICAVGVRSSYLQGQLAALGYTNVVDVAEGMLGGAAGPGWIASDLPVEPYE